jgi:serine/threonine-protein kinase RsbW
MAANRETFCDYHHCTLANGSLGAPNFRRVRLEPAICKGATACHEAAHAVLSYALGFGIESVSVGVTIGLREGRKTYTPRDEYRGDTTRFNRLIPAGDDLAYSPDLLAADVVSAGRTGGRATILCRAGRADRCAQRQRRRLRPSRRRCAQFAVLGQRKTRRLSTAALVASPGGARKRDHLVRCHMLGPDLTCVAIEVGGPPRAVVRQEMEIGSDFSELGRARGCVRSFCRVLPGLPLGEDELAELALAVNDAASNIMKHAYHGRVDRRIRLDIESASDQIVVRLHHHSDPFDPPPAPESAFDGSRESGYGLHILSRSVDYVHYYLDERGENCVALAKMYSP